MVNDVLFVFIVVLVLMAVSILYTLFGLFLSEYTIDNLLMFILANYNAHKFDLFHWRYSLVMDCIQIFLAFFVPVNFIVIPILWVIKNIIKKKKGN